MNKKYFPMVVMILLMVLLVGVSSAAAPVPVTTFTLVQGLPAIMNVGETYTVIVQVASDQPYTSVQALPDFQYAGKGVVAVQGGARAGAGVGTTLSVTFKAKSSTANMSGGVSPVGVVVGVRYGGGYVVSQRYDFNVQVP